MKSLKEHKVQILAALALAFSLGMVVPSAVFASDGGVETQAVQQQVTAADLATIITTVKAEDDYKNYATLAEKIAALPQDLSKATTDQTKAVLDAITPLLDGEGANIGDYTAAQLVDYVNKNMPGYALYKTAAEAVAKVQKYVNGESTTDKAITADTISSTVPAGEIPGYYTAVDNYLNRVTGTLAENVVKLNERVTERASLKGYRDAQSLIANVAVIEDEKSTEAQVATAAAAIRTALGTWVPAVDGLATMDAAQLVAKVKTMNNYDKYAALYNAMGFIRELTTGSTALTAAALNTKYTGAEGTKTLTDNYAKMAAAAQAIDPTIMKGLMAFELPDTSVGGDKKPEVNSPNTGIVGLIESGALDLGTITLIVTVGLASVAGLGLIAKLYLKHKF